MKYTLVDTTGSSESNFLIYFNTYWCVMAMLSVHYQWHAERANDGWWTALANVLVTPQSVYPLVWKEVNVFWIKRWGSILLYCVNITIESMHCFVVLSWLSAFFWFRSDYLRIDHVQSGEESFHEQTPLLLNKIQVQYVPSWCLEYAC